VAYQPFKIVGIAGSLRRASWNRGLLRAAVEGRPDGIEIVTLDLDLVPPYNQDVEDGAIHPASSPSRTSSASPMPS
jgi:chromate reductase